VQLQLFYEKCVCSVKGVRILFARVLLRYIFLYIMVYQYISNTLTVLYFILFIVFLAPGTRNLSKKLALICEKQRPIHTNTYSDKTSQLTRKHSKFVEELKKNKALIFKNVCLCALTLSTFLFPNSNTNLSIYTTS